MGWVYNRQATRPGRLTEIIVSLSRMTRSLATGAIVALAHLFRAAGPAAAEPPRPSRGYELQQWLDKRQKQHATEAGHAPPATPGVRYRWDPTSGAWVECKLVSSKRLLWPWCWCLR